MTRLQADLLLAACAALWGFSFLFQKSAMAHVEPWLFVSARMLVAAAVLAPFAMAEHLRSRGRSAAPLAPIAVVAGAVLLCAAVLQQVGLKTASVINAGFLTALYVVATPFAAFLITGLKIVPQVWGAVALSFVGAWLLGGGGLEHFGAGDLMVAVSALFWATHIVIVGLAARRGRPFLFTTLQFLIVGLGALAGAIVLEPIDPAQLGAAAVDILYTGIISGAFTFTAFTFAMRATRPTEAAIILSTEPLFAAAAAWVLLGERLGALGFAGAVAILAAVFIVQVMPKRQGRASV